MTSCLVSCITVHNFCQLPSVFYILLAVIFSQGKSSQWHTDIWGGLLPNPPTPWLCHMSLHILTVTDTIHPGQQTSSFQEGTSVKFAFVKQCALKYCAFHCSLPPILPRIVGLFPYYQGTQALHPVTYPFPSAITTLLSMPMSPFCLFAWSLQPLTSNRSHPALSMSLSLFCLLVQFDH